MGRWTRFFGSMGLAAILIIATAVPTLAANTNNPAEGTSCNFNKYLIMDAGDTVPNATFSFTVAPGNARSVDTSDNSKMEVLAGIGTPAIADVTFGPSDTTATAAGTNIDVARTNVQRGGAAGDAVQLDSGEKYATKQATVSFEGISFPEPGIYRYIITETASAAHAAAGIIHDTDNDRVLDVYVTDDGSGTLKISGYVLHLNDADVTINTDMGSSDVASDGAALEDKTDGFTNEYTTKDLKVEKQVAGNQASRDKWFEFTVTMAAETVNASDSFVVSIANDNDANTNDGNADATSGTTKSTRTSNQGQTNPTTVTGAQLLAGQKFYLQHGQSVVIRSLPLNANYTVTEDAEDYKSAAKNGATNSGVIGTIADANKMATAGFTNTRAGIIPTGIFLYAGIGIVLVVFAVLVFALTHKNRKRFTE